MRAVKHIYQISIINKFLISLISIWLRYIVFKSKGLDKIKKTPLRENNGAFKVAICIYFLAAALRSLVSAMTFSDTFCGHGL
jgi:hypothetical protein